MARGWESKAVEAQVEAANEEATDGQTRLSAEEIEDRRRRANLLLARAQVLQQLESSGNPRHRQMLEAALADLNRKLGQVG